jgi:hypothetical protein
MNKTQLSENGYYLTDIFDEEVLGQISNLCNEFIPTIVRPGAPDSTREALVIKDGMYKTICDHFKPLIEELTPGYRLMSDITVELWRDNPEYECPWHIDDPTVQNIIIVYLKDNNESIGTGYEEAGEKYSVPYQKNTGLVLCNSDNIRHGMVNKVPTNFVRHSLYITWKCFYAK